MMKMISQILQIYLRFNVILYIYTFLDGLLKTKLEINNLF